MLDLRLTVNGVAYGGWQFIRVHRGLEEISGSFDLGVSEIWPEQLQPREIRTGDKAVVQIDGTALITGYVDSAGPSYDATSHNFSARGRDATADLVDCAAIHSKGEWRNAKLDQIARDLAKPFGITVTVAGDLGAAFPSFAIEQGESAFECIERAARQRGVRLLSDGNGGLIVGAVPAITTGVSLVEGENLLSAGVTNDESERFGEYIIKGQQAGNDDVNGAAAASVKATAKDAGIKRYRPLVIIDEDQGDIAGFQRRAKWEASVRAARALTVNCKVQGWRLDKTRLWQPNMLVRFTAPRLRLDRELLIRDVDFVVDASGTYTDLVLTPKEAYSLLPTPAPQKAPKRKKAKQAGDAPDILSSEGA